VATKAATTIGTTANTSVAAEATIHFVVSTVARLTGVASRCRIEESSTSVPSTEVPLTAMIIGTSVLGTEVDDSSILHLLATPVSRATVMTTKWIVASAATLVFAVVPIAVASFIATSGYVDNPGPFDMTFTPIKGEASEAVGVIVAAAVGAVVYSAFFLFLSVVTKRSVAVTLIYILVWESLLTRQVSGLRLLSIGQYELGLADRIGHLPNLGAHLTMSTSVVMSVVFTVVALVYGTRRLQSFRVSGEAT